MELKIQDGSVTSDSSNTSSSNTIEPLPGLGVIFEELLQEDGYGFIIALHWKMSVKLWHFIMNTSICLEAFIRKV